MTGIDGTVYLLHFDRPYRHARHYTGWASDLDARLAEHAAGHGARLTAVVRDAGIGWVLARTWSGTRHRERQLKCTGGAARRCPLCRRQPHGRVLDDRTLGRIPTHHCGWEAVGMSTVDYQGMAGELPGHAAVIADHLRRNGFNPDQAVNRQVLGLAEEVGEFVGAYRRWSGQARRAGTAEQTCEELADVIITAFVTAHELGVDIGTVIAATLHKVYTRGWRETPAVATEGGASA